jgi:thiol-disulfide isomerase/thioredoxin
MRPTGSEFHAGEVLSLINHGDETGEEIVEDSVPLTGRNFDTFTHQFPILVVNFYAPWCYWCNLLKPSWEKAAKQIKERYDPEMDGRVILAKVDCTQEGDLCRRNHIQGYPSIRIFRKGSDLKDDNAHHDHESYYGDRDTESLVKMVVSLVEPIHLEPHNLALEDKSDNSSRTLKKAPSTGGCRVEGYMRVKKVPGNLMVSARSGSHSFDSSQMNMSHVVNHLSFGRRIMPQKFSEFKRLSPYLGLSHDRLDGRSFINQRDLGPNVTIEHYLQIVKTEVVKSNGQALVEAYEYTAHSSVAHSYYLPVAKFHFELSPMQVLITENSKSFSHFITNVCAIIGGVFTVAGILDSILHHSMTLMKKIELGKNF